MVEEDLLAEYENFMSTSRSKAVTRYGNTSISKDWSEEEIKYMKGIVDSKIDEIRQVNRLNWGCDVHSRMWVIYQHYLKRVAFGKEVTLPTEVMDYLYEVGDNVYLMQQDEDEMFTRWPGLISLHRR